MASGTSISHARVLVDWEQHALPNLLKLEKVMPGLVQRKVVPKKLSKGIVKKNDLQTFLGILKVKPIEVFVEFLQALADTFPEYEAHRELVLLMRDSLECIIIPPESEACRAAIQEVIARAELKDQPTSPTPHPEPQPGEELQKSGYVEPCRSWGFTKEGGSFYCPAHGIVGHIPSSAIPPDVEKFKVGMKVFMHKDCTFPADVEPCTAIVEFSLSPSFEFAEDITVKIPHCVVIDGKVDPEIFCLLKTTKRGGPKFEVLEARYSNHYYVVANLRHFCKVVGGCRILLHRQRRWSASRSDRTGISKRRSSSSTRDLVKKIRESPNLQDLHIVRQVSSVSSSGSFERSNSWEDHETDSIPPSPEIDYSMSSCRLTRQKAFDSGRSSLLVNQQSSSEDAFGSYSLYVIQGMPNQCSAEGWKTHFLLSCALPTGMLVLLQDGFRVEAKRLCRATESHLEFHPQHWNEDGWDVHATGTPLIDTLEVTQFSHFHPEQVESLVNAGLYPPRVSYVVHHTDAHALNPVPLKCRIDVKGVEINGKPLYFMLTSPPQMITTDKPSRTLHTCQDLYHESAVCSALSSGSDLPLDPQSEDHHRLIADISFQLTEGDLQCLVGRGMLRIEKSNCHVDTQEQIYKALLSWMSRLDSSISICGLLSILKTVGISGIEVRSWSAESIEKKLCSQFSKCPVQCNNKFLFDLAQQVQQYQSFIGRFIGMSEADISATIQDNAPESQSELSYQILWAWQRRKGREATYGTLFMAIFRMFEHYPSSFCGAWWLVTKEYMYFK